MTKTKYWLPILAISVVLVAGSLAVSPIAIAGDDDVKAKIKAKLKLEQDGTDVIVEVKAKGLASDTDFTVRAYISSVTNCLRGGTHAIFDFDVTSDGDGNFAISETILDNPTANTGATVVVGDVGSVSIRNEGGPGTNPPVVCFQDP